MATTTSSSRNATAHTSQQVAVICPRALLCSPQAGPPLRRRPVASPPAREEGEAMDFLQGRSVERLRPPRRTPWASWAWLWPRCPAASVAGGGRGVCCGRLVGQRQRQIGEGRDKKNFRNLTFVAKISET
ncbi:hypothetical protein ZWY2020_053933 [Hordeum vulgare]|nr:hypothetical protein ZWY2020_053933 [Hordeum vulgare]